MIENAIFFIFLAIYIVAGFSLGTDMSIFGKLFSSNSINITNYTISNNTPNNAQSNTMESNIGDSPLGQYLK